MIHLANNVKYVLFLLLYSANMHQRFVGNRYTNCSHVVNCMTYKQSLKHIYIVHSIGCSSSLWEGVSGARAQTVQCTVIIIIKVCYKMSPEKVFKFRFE